MVGDNHGTLLAEAVVDIAPEASLYIASPWSKGDSRDAVDWMISQGVSVIVSGVNFTFDGPGDGTSPFGDSPLKNVDRAVSGGIVWVNSAGNSAQSTWFGTYSNRDSDEWIEFDIDYIETNKISLSKDDVLKIQLRWEGIWGQENTDLDMVLYDSDINPVWYGGDYQTGPLAGDFPVPWDYMRYEVPSDGDYYLAISHQSGLAPDWIQVTVWGVESIEHYTERGSIANPAESANHGMLAVGAAPWSDVDTIEPFSSWGPTPDGRVKPDIVGADCGETALIPLNANRNGFCGTSQSAAHVAGMAALVRQRFPTYKPAQVANYLKEHAEQRGSPDPNNTWGHGFAQLLPVSECSAGVAVANAANNPGLVSDCDALLAARDALNWSATLPIADWDGVTLGGSPLRVTGLFLGLNQLTGTIPPELGNLTNLAELDLGDNQLTGTIPVELGRLTNLRTLALGWNQLTGPVPTWLGNLTDLEWLHLAQNQLSGTIPSQLASLTDLEWLHLAQNQLSGPIPPELARLANLEELFLGHNQLTGPVPTWLGNLTDLEWLHLGGNQLTGEIPTELGSMTNLTYLNLGDNQLTGPIPPELGRLTNLWILDLGDNQLTGPVPTWLGNLTDLEWLHLAQNQLSGPIPPELASLTNLEWLRLAQNQLSGPVPPELASLTNLVNLKLSDNQLTGTIPPEFGRLANLAVLALGDNQLTGTIPPELGNLTNLWILALGDNQLTGTIPPELGNLTNLWILALGGNQLSGTIPSQLASPTNLQELALGDNQLTGTIPPELGNLTNLRILALGGNQLTGTIPTGLGSLANLEELFLSGNQLTGCIPAEIAGVANNDLNQLGLLFCTGVRVGLQQ